MDTSKLWENIEDPATGRKSLTENIQPKVIMRGCPDGEHRFEPITAGEAHCRKCGVIARYAVGVQSIKDGLIVKG